MTTALEDVDEILYDRTEGTAVGAALRLLARTADELSERIYYLENRQTTADDYTLEMRDRG